MTKSFIVLENIQEYFVIYIYHNIYIVIEKKKKKIATDRAVRQVNKQTSKRTNLKLCE